MFIRSILRKSMFIRSILLVTLAAAYLGSVFSGSALAQTYVEPESRYVGAGGEVVVYSDTTDGVEINCTSGAACLSTRHVQLDPGYQDSAIFVRGYLLSWDRPGASANDPREMGFSVDISNYNSVTGQLDWTAQANFLGDTNFELTYFVTVTIILANTSPTNKVMEFARLSTACNGNVEIGNCAGSAIAETPPGMDPIAAPVRTLFVSSGTNATRVRQMGFDSSGVGPHPTLGPAVTQLTSKCELRAGPVGTSTASHAFTCNMNSVMIFADLGILHSFFPMSRSDLGISLSRTWFSSAVDPGLGAVFAGLIAHGQDPNPATAPAPSGAEFFFTRGECAAAFNPPNVDFLERTLLGDSSSPGWTFDARIVCLRVEVN